MTFDEKLSRLRKMNNYTQEQLAEVLGVTRQSVGKWESGAAYPETDKLIRLSELFHCSLDYLLKDTEEAPPKEEISIEEVPADEPPADAPGTTVSTRIHRIGKRHVTVTTRTHFPFRERKSERIVMGVPLWHIGRNAHGIIAIGLKARGVIAMGLYARGILAMGLLSMGVFAFGVLALGAIAFGVLAVALLAMGSFAFGPIASGAISFGIVSLGAVAIGDFSAGALAVGRFIAIGDHARAAVAFGQSETIGSALQFHGTPNAQTAAEAIDWLRANVPAHLGWAREIFEWILSFF